MKNKMISAFIIIFSFIFFGCDKSIEIRELDLFDYVYIENISEKLATNKIDAYEGIRVKGFLIKNSPNNLQDLENYIIEYTNELLSEEFISDSENKIFESNKVVGTKNIEINFFRTSNELPWVIDENYIYPYHIGEGNPKDWIGSVLFNIDRNEIDYYWVAKRKKGMVDYGKILEKKEYGLIESRTLF